MSVGFLRSPNNTEWLVTLLEEGARSLRFNFGAIMSQRGRVEVRDEFVDCYFCGCRFIYPRSLSGPRDKLGHTWAAAHESLHLASLGRRGIDALRARIALEKLKRV